MVPQMWHHLLQDLILWQTIISKHLQQSRSLVRIFLDHSLYQSNSLLRHLFGQLRVHLLPQNGLMDLIQLLLEDIMVPKEVQQHDAQRVYIGLEAVSRSRGPFGRDLLALHLFRRCEPHCADTCRQPSMHHLLLILNTLRLQ